MSAKNANCPFFLIIVILKSPLNSHDVCVRMCMRVCTCVHTRAFACTFWTNSKLIDSFWIVSFV